MNILAVGVESLRPTTTKNAEYRGALKYSVGPSGKIIAVITFPQSASILNNTPWIIGRYEPIEIKRELIWDHVERFLQEQTKFEDALDNAM